MSKLTRRLVVAMLLGVVVYGVLIAQRDAHKVAAVLTGYAWWTFAAACGLALSNYVLRFLKWEYYLALLDIRGVPKSESFLTFLSGFVLTVTPGKVGEVFKSVILNQTRGVPIARTAPIVVAERVTDLIAVIALITVGSLRFPGGIVWGVLGTVLVGALLGVVASPRLAHGLVTPLAKLPGPLGRAARRLVPKALEALDGLRHMTALRRLVWPTLLSVAAWFLEGLGLWVILGGFKTAVPTLGLTVFSYATATLAGALVPVPGGLGVVEKLLDEQLHLLGGVPGPIATAAMILVRFATLWFAVGVGFAALGVLRLRHPGLQPNAAADPDAVPPGGVSGGAATKKALTAD